MDNLVVFSLRLQRVQSGDPECFSLDELLVQIPPLLLISTCSITWYFNCERLCPFWRKCVELITLYKVIKSGHIVTYKEKCVTGLLGWERQGAGRNASYWCFIWLRKCPHKKAEKKQSECQHSFLFTTLASSFPRASCYRRLLLNKRTLLNKATFRQLSRLQVPVRWLV